MFALVALRECQNGKESFYLTTHSTHFIYGYMIIIFLKSLFDVNTLSSSSFNGCLGSLRECRNGRKEMFYLTTHSTHFIYGYMVIIIFLNLIRCKHIIK